MKNDQGEWFVVHLKNNQLKKAILNLTRQNFETFAPIMRDTKATLLFPGYVFVKFDQALDNWPKINNTLGVSRVLSSKRGTPLPLPNGWINTLINQCGKGDVLMPEKGLSLGDEVRIIRGPFENTLFKIEEIDRDGRLKFLFSMLGSKTMVSVSRENVM